MLFQFPQGLLGCLNAEFERMVVGQNELFLGRIDVVYEYHVYNQTFADAYEQVSVCMELLVNQLFNGTELHGDGAFFPIAGVNVRVVALTGDIDQAPRRNAGELVGVGKGQMVGHCS